MLLRIPLAQDNGSFTFVKHVFRKLDKFQYWGVELTTDCSIQVLQPSPDLHRWAAILYREFWREYADTNGFALQTKLGIVLIGILAFSMKVVEKTSGI